MKNIIKKATAILLALTLILCWVAFAEDIKVSAETYAVATPIRIYGNDRYDTANKIATKGWTTASTVVLASGTSYPDALAGAPLAYALDAPILLVSGTSVPFSVMQQIYALGATNIYILGGTAAVSSSIESELKGKGFSVDRIWGQTRYETAVEVAKALINISGPSNEAFIVSGENYPDALAVSPVAALKGTPIVYSNKSGSIDSGSANLLRSAGTDSAYIIGGTAAISDSVKNNLNNCGISQITRISGASRYDTALKVADYFINVFTAKSIAFATGENYPDALAGGVFAAKKGMPVLLTNEKLSAEQSSSIFLTAYAYNDSLSFTENLVDFIERFAPEEVFIFGGEKAVPNEIIDSYFDGETWGGETESTTTESTTTESTTTESTIPTEAPDDGLITVEGTITLDKSLKGYSMSIVTIQVINGRIRKAYGGQSSFDQTSPLYGYILTSGTGEVVYSGTPNADGTYSITIPNGEYTICVYINDEAAKRQAFNYYSEQTGESSLNLHTGSIYTVTGDEIFDEILGDL